MAKEYKKLNKFEDYDQEAVEELAEAMNEYRELQARLELLEDLVQENNDLLPFVWTTAENKTIALHKIEEDHFKNILQFQVNRGQKISKALKTEAARRLVTLPSTPKVIERDSTDVPKRLPVSNDMDDLDSIPF